ncbi:MAG: hypothetical protein K0U93_13235 [Gammaproteobacteria bacterium]|nr:hypothetical protein [Gammaproteobacteria bacterium]
MPRTCPKCRLVRPANTAAPSWQCPRCGIAYDKFRLATIGECEDIASPAAPASVVSAPTTRGLGDVILYSIVVTALLAAARAAFFDGLSFVNSLLLAPFFFSLVPVLSWLFLRELWQWRRDGGGFEHVSVVDSPILGYALLGFWLAATAIFGAFVLTLDR